MCMQVFHSSYCQVSIGWMINRILSIDELGIQVSFFGYYEYCLKYCIQVFCMDMYSDWGIYIEVELLGHMVSLRFTFLRNQQFSIAAVPFYIPTSDKWRFHFPHVLTNAYCFIIGILVGMKWCFIVVLTYVSLMIRTLSIFSHASAICIPFFILAKGLQDPSFPTRGWMYASCNRSTGVLTIGMPGNLFIYWEMFI